VKNFTSLCEQQKHMATFLDRPSNRESRNAQNRGGNVKENESNRAERNIVHGTDHGRQLGRKSVIIGTIKETSSNSV
jgi:hypothetical protein